MVVMKRILIAALLMLSFAACSSDEKPADKTGLDITGDWNIVGITTKSAVFEGETVDIWISFKNDNTFAMYQKIGAGRYTPYSGTWTLAETKLTGKYSDGNAWAAEYEVALEDGGNTLVLTSPTGEVDTYKKGTVPADVQNNVR